LAVVLSCANFNDNPLDPDFSGDCHLSATWSALDSAHLEALCPYRVAFTQGADAFVRLDINAPIDTAALATAYAAGDSLTLTFTEAFAGTLRITGIRPNG
jgi:hypothetical protein